MVHLYLGSRQASYTSHMSRMSYNSHGDLLNGKPPAMSGSKDYRSAANRVAAANASSASRPTLVPDLVVEHSRHYHHHHHNQNHDYVMTNVRLLHLFCPFLSFFFLGGSVGFLVSNDVHRQANSNVYYITIRID
jgi:hypothetical protein